VTRSLQVDFTDNFVAVESATLWRLTLYFLITLNTDRVLLPELTG